MQRWIGRQQSGSEANAPPPPTVNPTVVVYAPAGGAGPIALVDVARARAGGSDEAVIVERAGAGVRVRQGLRAEVGLADRDRPQRLEAQCVLGVVCAGEGAFFALCVTESDEVIRRNVLGAGTVRNIRRVAFTPLDTQSAFVLDNSRSAEPSLPSKIVAQLRSDLEDERGFFFSDSLDMTATLQRQADAARAGGEAGLHARVSDPRFYWNAQMLHPFAVAGVDEPWLSPAMRGHVGCCEGRMCDNRLAYAAILISRRSCEHAGTRYHTRGCNDDGHAANFVETESALVVVRMPGQQPPPQQQPPPPSGPWRASWVQVRGSVPLFWSQSGMQYKPKPVMHRTAAQNVAVLQRHLSRASRAYGEPICLLSLLSTQPSSDEAELAQKLKETCEAMGAERASGAPPPPRACCLPFDFHAETRGGKLNAVYTFAQRELVPSLQRLGCSPGLPPFFVVPRPGEAPAAMQAGVVRTNCLDCLDRTNVVQHCLARLVLAQMLQRARIDMAGMHGGSEAGAWEAECARAADGVQKLWTDNGHALSLQYAGTASLKSSMLKGGPEADAAEPEQRSRLTAAAGLASSLASRVTDGANSLQRYYVSNFKDDVRQQTVDALLAPLPGMGAYVRALPTGASTSGGQPPPPVLRLLVASWNVNGKGPKEDGTQAVIDWLRCAYPAGGQSEPPDVVVFGMQELIALDVKHALTADVASRIATWRTAMTAALEALFKPSGATFECVESKNMFGVQTWLFIDNRHAANLSKLVAESVKIGFGGTVGNKGGVGMRFRLYDRAICFINAHLPSGSKEVDARNIAYTEIINALHASIRFGRDCRALEHDACVWFGDLNYRVARPNEQVRSAVAVHNFLSILEHDQLTVARDSRAAFSHFEEAPISFAPTYKYDPGTDDFDTSEKARTPSWTDRVLFRGEGVSCKLYTSSMALRASDHKPICALLELVPTPGSDAERAARIGASDGRATARSTPLPRPPPAVDLLGAMDDSDDDAAARQAAAGTPRAAVGDGDPFGFGALALTEQQPNAQLCLSPPGFGVGFGPSNSSFASDVPSDGANGPHVVAASFGDRGAFGGGRGSDLSAGLESPTHGAFGDGGFGIATPFSVGPSAGFDSGGVGFAGSAPFGDSASFGDTAPFGSTAHFGGGTFGAGEDGVARADASHDLFASSESVPPLPGNPFADEIGAEGGGGFPPAAGFGAPISPAGSGGFPPTAGFGAPISPAGSGGFPPAAGFGAPISAAGGTPFGAQAFGDGAAPTAFASSTNSVSHGGSFSTLPALPPMQPVFGSDMQPRPGGMTAQPPPQLQQPFFGAGGGLFGSCLPPAPSTALPAAAVQQAGGMMPPPPAWSGGMASSPLAGAQGRMACGPAFAQPPPPASGSALDSLTAEALKKFGSVKK